MRKKIAALALLLAVGVNYGAYMHKLPQNWRLDTDTVEVYANKSDTTSLFSFGAQTYRVLKISIADTSSTTQSDLDIGDGVKVWQLAAFPFANISGYDTASMAAYDSTFGSVLYTTMGDTQSILFDNAEGLTADSIICSTMDTSKMEYTILGKDSLWMSDGYAALLPDPTPLTAFKVTGASDCSDTVAVIFWIWTMDGTPTSDEE